ncbi:Ig-like domain-containing protein [Shewanella sp. SM74]|uniref:Ig-like domain-containing protein n=1 Tax=Shewanella sp. SM74 TaxID=2912807 RepID=UPI0021D8943B|nr:Ig-like domain-containing protein [Shewanella sp. SM74]MCU8013901.1 Ig-like domain-containing protein [Shewanella sp. SM74]
MNKTLLTSFSSLLLPLGLYGVPMQTAGTYQRSYLSTAVAGYNPAYSDNKRILSPQTAQRRILAEDELDIVSAVAVSEMVVIDSAVPDKQQFYRAVKPGVDIVEIESSAAGLTQLKSILANYKNLTAVHIVSHARAGSLQLGNSTISAETLKTEVETFAALNGAVREGGDLLLYGCDLASTEAGEELLDIVQRNTHLDVAASNDLTGNIQQQGDWDLEIQRGNIETELAFSEKALKDFSAVLATYNLLNFTYNGNTPDADVQPGNPSHCPDNSPSQNYNYGSLSSGNYIACGFMHNNGYSGTTVALANYFGGDTNAFLKTAGGLAVAQETVSGTNHIEVRRSSGAFQLANVVAGEFPGSHTFSSVKVIGYVSGGGTIESTAITSDTGAANTFTFISGSQLSNFVGVNLTKFRLAFVNAGGSNLTYMTLNSFEAEPADNTGPTIGAISNQNIVTGGDTGALAFTVGDNYTPVASINVTRASSNTTAVPLANVVLGGSGANRTVTVTGASVGTSTITITATDRSGNATNRTFDVVVASPDATPPTITSVNSSTANGTYKVGDAISIQVNFDESVIVTGTPQLELETGTTDRVASCASGTGTSMTCTYTVQAGDTTTDLDYVATNSLALNGGTIRDAAANNATLTLASPGAANSLGANKAIIVDGVAPTVNSVSVPANATYIAGQNLDFTINFNDNVTVNTGGGTPQLSITVGATTRQATYQSGSGTGVLLFRYTVQAGESDTDGISVGTLSANGGTLRDSASNNANLTLNSVGATTSVLVDATAPAVTSVTVPANATYTAGQNLNFTINFGENVTVNTGGGTPQLSITVGATTRQATYQSGSGTGALLFRYTVQAGESDTDGIAVGTLSANGGTLRDSASNNANLTLNSVGATTSVLVDAVAPSVTSIAPSGSPAANAASMDFAVTFDESVNNISTDDFALVTTGTAAGTIASVSAVSGSTVNVTINTISGTGTLKLNLNGSTNIADAAGNGIAAYNSGTSHSVDRDVPAAPSTPDLDAGSDTGVSNTDNNTSDNTPTFTGTAEANATVTVISSLSGTLGTTTADGSGDWSFTAGAMANGIHNITATATDAAANVSSASAALAVTIDGPVTVTTNADSGADATIDGSLGVDLVDGGGLSLREALNYVAASGTVDFAVGLNGTTITLGAPLTVPAGITIDADALGTASITGSTFTLAGGLSLTNGSGDRLTLGSELSSAGALTKTGAGRLILTNTNNNSHSGDVTVTAGELWIGSDSAFSTGTLTLNGGVLGNNMASFNLDNPIVLGASGGGIQVLSAAQILTLSGNISGAGALSKTSGGNLTLSGTNSFSGGLAISGTNGVTVADSTNLGSGAVTINASSLLTLTGSAQTVTNAIVLAGDATITNDNAMTISGVISSTGGLTKSGAGVLTLSGTNTATGAINVAAGGLALAGGSAVADTVPVTVGAGATLSLPAGNETIGSIAGAGNVVLSYRLTTGGDNSSTTFSGVISSTNVSGITKNGSGTFKLTGTNSYTGSTQVSAGSLIVNGSNSTSSDVTVASGATLGGLGTAPGVVINSGGNLAPGDSGIGILSIANGLTINSGGNLLLDIAGTTAVMQYDRLNVAGTVSLSGANISATHSYVAANGDSYTVITNDGADAISGTFSGIAEGGAFVASGNSSNLITSYAGGDGNDLSLTNTLLPGAPTAVSAAAGDGSAQVSFTAPASNGGSAISGYTVTANPGGATVTGASSPINFPGLTNGTAYTFTVTATNAAGTSAVSAASNSVTPQPSNSAPTITGSPILTINQGASYLFTPTATDSPGETLSFSILNKPVWATFNPATGTLSGTPSNQDVGMTNGIVISVSDGTLSASLPAFNLSVANVNDAPTISSTAVTTATQDTAYSYTVVAADTDVGDVLTFSAVTKPSWLNFNAATGLLSGTPGNADVGSHAVLLRVTDTDGLTAEQSFSITVTNVNDAPTISSTAVTTATQDTAYSYTLVAADTDVGDVLTFSTVTKPSWLSFNAATGLLSGTPSNSDVGAHPVTLRVADTDGLTAEQSFSITVTNTNNAPVATSSTVTLEEDGSVMITLTAVDADNDPLTYEVVSQPESGTLEQHGTVWLYTPEKDFNGTDMFSFIAKDAELSSEPATVTINVTPVNDDPQAVDDDYTLTSTANDMYALAVLANDVDVDGDTLTIDGAAADIGSVQITSEGLSFTAPEAYVGPVALRYTISDGNKGRASAKVNVLIEGTESDNQPVITLPDDVDVNATGLFTRVELGFAKAVDRNGHPLPVSLVNKSLFFAPGSYLAYWQAIDRDGNKAIKAQKVKVHPLISLSKDQLVGEGNEVVVSVHLNGAAPVYPLSVPYTVSGSAGSGDHDLVDGVVEVTSGQQAEIRFSTFEDGEVEGDEDVLISLDPSLNLGSKQQTQVLITEANIAPKVTLDVTQAGVHQFIVAQNGGDVRIDADISDANMQDSLASTWASGSLNLQSDDAGMFFSPVSVLPGIYPVSVTVTDNGLPALSTTEQVYIVVRSSLPILTGADTDGDLIPDVQEGFTDSDDDGIPDYLDAINDCNIMPEGELQPVYFLAEGQAGVCLRLGNIALMQEQSGIQLLPDLVPEDSIAANVGGIFDFIATGLPQQGQSYSLVIPQRSPVPANAVYRKYQAQNGWKDFVIDTRNSVASSEGERGFCPPPGDSRWTSGLTEGHWCVQLTIEDGGPNDDDGIANRTIVDPSGVSVILNGNHLPVANPDTASLPWNQSLDVDVLANDTDSDGDALTVTQVTSEFGTAVILANQQLSYTPATDFIGTDVLVYSITDGKGGTASSELTVVVSGNTAPTTVNDSAATDDRTSLLLDVLSNDSDPDGNALTLVSATAQQGTVSIETNKLRYIPKTGFDGVDTVSYQISDGLGGEATGQVLITVKAYQEVVIDNKSGGGSLSLWALGLLITTGLIRRRKLHKVVLGAVLLASTVTQANAADNWYAEGFVGQAQADSGRRELQSDAAAGVVTSVDDKDTAFGLSVGYQWTPMVAIELGYADFGNGSARIEGASLTPAQYHEQVKAVTPVLADGVMLGLRLTLLQHDAWRFEVPIGLFRWQADISSTMGNSRLTTELDGTDWYAGVRFSYQVSDAWSVGLGYQYVDIEPNDFLSYQLNLRYQF